MARTRSQIGCANSATAGDGRLFPLESTLGNRAQRRSNKRQMITSTPFALLREFADYITLNVSSPNTPGLRELQEPQKLSELLQTIGKEAGATPKPVVVKISPDILPTDLKAILAVCEEHQVAGIIATNTTLDHSSIPPQLDQEGGLSGAPLREKIDRIRP